MKFKSLLVGLALLGVVGGVWAEEATIKVFGLDQETASSLSGQTPELIMLSATKPNCIFSSAQSSADGITVSANCTSLEDMQSLQNNIANVEMKFSDGNVSLSPSGSNSGSAASVAGSDSDVLGSSDGVGAATTGVIEVHGELIANLGKCYGSTKECRGYEKKTR